MRGSKWWGGGERRKQTALSLHRHSDCSINNGNLWGLCFYESYGFCMLRSDFVLHEVKCPIFVLVQFSCSTGEFRDCWENINTHINNIMLLSFDSFHFQSFHSWFYFGSHILFLFQVSLLPVRVYPLTPVTTCSALKFYTPPFPFVLCQFVVSLVSRLPAFSRVFRHMLWIFGLFLNLFFCLNDFKPSQKPLPVFD